VELKEDVFLRADGVTQGWWENFKRNSSLSLRSGDSTAGVRMDAKIRQYGELY